MNIEQESTINTFHVDEKRKKIWSIQIELLHKLDEVCRENSLQYFVFWGALLGAVRHKGFVPWDDDIDVVMPRKDYDRLCELQNQVFQYPYYLHTSKNADERTYYVSAELIREDTTYIDTTIREDASNHWGLQLDIAPLDGIPASSKLRQKQYKKVKLLSMLESIYMRKWNSFRIFGKVMKLPCWLLFKIIPFSRIPEKIEALRRQYAYEDCAMVGDSSHGVQFYKEDFRDVVMLDFENTQISAPIGYKRVLEMLYGDYMQIPPLLSRIIPESVLNGYVSEPEIPYKMYQQALQAHRNGRVRSSQNRKKSFMKKYAEQKARGE